MEQNSKHCPPSIPCISGAFYRMPALMWLSSKTETSQNPELWKHKIFTRSFSGIPWYVCFRSPSSSDRVTFTKIVFLFFISFPSFLTKLRYSRRRPFLCRHWIFFCFFFGRNWFNLKWCCLPSSSSPWVASIYHYLPPRFSYTYIFVKPTKKNLHTTTTRDVIV